MDTMHEGDDPDQKRRLACLAVLGTVMAIAEALRREFGDGIDAHPGGVGIHAGAVNRAFREVTGVILQEVGSVEYDDAPAVFQMVLRDAALGRLHELGAIGDAAERLIDSEPGLGDAWLAYVTLAPESVIDDLMGDTRGG